VAYSQSLGENLAEIVGCGVRKEGACVRYVAAGGFEGIGPVEVGAVFSGWEFIWGLAKWVQKVFP